MSANSLSVYKNKEDVTLSYLDISLKIIKIFNSIKRQGSIIIHLKYFSVSDWVNSHGWFFLTLGRTRKFLSPPWNKRRGRGGGGDGTAPRLQYFETILPLVESLWASWQVEVYFMGSGAAGDMYFHAKLTWLPASYDVISRNRGNWPSPNVSQNLCEGGTISLWKGGIHPPPPPLVRPRVNLNYSVDEIWKTFVIIK